MTPWLTLKDGAMFVAVLRKSKCGTTHSKTLGSKASSIKAREMCGREIGPFVLEHSDAHYYYTTCERTLNRHWWNFRLVEEPSEE